MVDASAARGTDGKLYLSLVNVHPTRATRIETSLTGRATGRILTGPDLDTRNTFERPETIQPAAFEGTTRDGRLSFDLPAKSIAVVAVD
jgi:alpha-N-arabinofuranosidase